MSDPSQQPYPQGDPAAQGQGYGAPGFPQAGPGPQSYPNQSYPNGAPQQQPYPQDASGGQYGPPPGPPPVGAQMKQRNIFAVWLLPVVTFGIYGLVWYYKIHNEMKQFDPRAKIDPTGSLLTVMFGGFLCLIPPLVSYYNTGQRIANAQRAAGLPQTCAPILGLVLNFLAGVGGLYYQAELNKIIVHYGSVPPGSPVQLAV